MWSRGRAAAGKPVEGPLFEPKLQQIFKGKQAPGLGRGRCLETSQAYQQPVRERVSKWEFPGLFSSLLLSSLTGTLADLLQPAVWTGQKLFLHSHPLTSKDCYSAL